MVKNNPQRSLTRQPLSRQTGGTFLGFVLGLIVALSIAVIIALYITRSPTPFVNKSGGAGDTSASASLITPASQFDPNRILQGKSPGQPVSSALANRAPPTAANTQPASQSGLFQEPQIVEVPAASAAAAPTAAAPKAPSQTQHTPAASAAAELAGKTPGADEANTSLFLQVGAYKTSQDAQQERAKLALQGFESTVSQRDSGGITYYRVRIGPYSNFEEMTGARQQLSSAGIDSTVIRFTKQ